MARTTETARASHFITVGRENSTPIELYYEDHGAGKPVVLIHGWPLSAASWERQAPALVKAGYRAIAYDRRGFGASSKPAGGYDYDTFAADLDKILTELDLNDAALVGFSMGGGEVARYLGRYGSKRVSKAVFIAAIPPFLPKSAKNPDGVDAAVFEGIKKGLEEDRYAFFDVFLKDFYNADVLQAKISEQAIRSAFNVAARSSVDGALACVSAWLEDFRRDATSIDVPTLIIHGDADRVLPIGATARPLKEIVKGSTLVEIKGGPHGLTWTHAEQVNRELLAFLASKR